MNKKHRLNKKRRGCGFTLIELLVVIAIIAILAAIAVPAQQGAMIVAQQNAAVAQARQISIGLRMYGNDNGGSYPSGTNSYGEKIVTSNDAFRSLVPTYIDNETVFTVPRSKAGPKADNKIEPQQEILRPGECHFAMVDGLSLSSNSNWPLIVDSTDGAGSYTTDETALGGTWQGKKAVVVRTDGSASCIPLAGTGKKRFLPRYNDATKNALVVSDYMGAGAALLEPAHK